MTRMAKGNELFTFSDFDYLFNLAFALFSAVCIGLKKNYQYLRVWMIFIQPFINYVYARLIKNEF